MVVHLLYSTCCSRCTSRDGETRTLKLRVYCILHSDSILCVPRVCSQRQSAHLRRDTRAHLHYHHHLNHLHHLNSLALALARDWLDSSKLDSTVCAPSARNGVHASARAVCTRRGGVEKCQCQRQMAAAPIRCCRSHCRHRLATLHSALPLVLRYIRLSSHRSALSRSHTLVSYVSPVALGAEQSRAKPRIPGFAHETRRDAREDETR